MRLSENDIFYSVNPWFSNRASRRPGASF